MPSLIEVKDLTKYFKTKSGYLHAVEAVNMSFEKGKTMGVVGESGCGKSTLGRLIIHLLDSTSGQIFYNGENVTHPKKRELHALREKLQIIFQDPYSSIDPRMTVEETLMEPLNISGKFRNSFEREKEVLKLMDTVGLPRRMGKSYPHELDGGRRQRIGIGRALALEPDFIVCDEPVSALDVSIQAQILNLLKSLQIERGITYMFVTHNMAVVRHISQSISVMYLGEIVETCSTEALFDSPLHPYTKALLSAIPSVDINKKHDRIILRGELSSPIDPEPGCRFASRCPYAGEMCSEPQELDEIMPEHYVACCRCGEINAASGQDVQADQAE